MGETMNKIGLLCVALLVFSFFSSMSYADYNIEKGKNLTIYAPVTNGLNPINATTINITIYYLNGTTALNTVLMHYTSLGNYEFFYVPNQTGQFIGTVRAVVAGKTYTRDVQISVVEDRQMILAITITLLFLSIFFVYIGKDLYTKPMSTHPEFASATKWIDLKKWGVLFVSLSAWSLVVLVAILTDASTGATYNPIMQAVFFVTIAIMGLFTILYTAYFFIFAFYNSFERIKKIK